MARVALRKLLKSPPKAPRHGECTCGHPRIRHVKPFHYHPMFSKRFYACNVRGCKCFIAANKIKARPPREGNRNGC